MKKANHIILNNKTILDLRQDSVAPESLLTGATAHDKSGQSIEGIAISPTGEITIVANGSYDVASYAVAAINVPKETMEFYDGLVIITRQEPEEKPLDPEFNHYGVIPEGCILGYTDASDEYTELSGGESFPADRSIYANYAMYDCGVVRYEINDGEGWRYIETIMAPEDGYVSVLNSIDGIPVTAIESTAGQLGPSLVTLELPTSIMRIQSVVPLRGVPNTLTSIIYLGTIEQWNNITLEDDWNSGCPEITVTCTDGTITIPAYGS